ncbi:MAG: YjbH domain-containing protein [Ascidiaceihabitans sp.]|nr:YjbH domain-containing protein [Ascidiaceihabitans sp.]
MLTFRHSAIMGTASVLALGSAIGLICTPQSASAQEQTPTFAVSPQPSLNFYGLPGLVDTPTAEALPDVQVALGVSHFGGTTRTTLTFQATPRISASFRYVGIQNWNSNGYSTYRDRSFDVRYLALRERKYLPAVSIGLQDFAGTGIYAGEYIVATKTFETANAGTIKLTGGLGWGRLGSNGSIGAPFGVRGSFTAGSTGGSPSVDQWFRGDVAPFGGVEWLVNDKLGLKAEYSSDAYLPETSRGVFSLKSRVNFGVEYQYSERLRLGGYYLYGSEVGINAQLQLNPKQALTPTTVSAPTPVLPRPSRNSNPAAWRTDWANSQTAPAQLRDALVPALSKEGLTLEELAVSANSAELRISNQRYNSQSLAIGRAARVLAQTMPPSVETFRIVTMQNGLALSTVTIRRSDLETLEFVPNNSEALLAVTGINAASPSLAGGVTQPGLYPQMNYSIGPYVAPSYFDPDQPVRADASIRAEFRYRFAPGWLVSGEVRHRLGGNVGDSTRTSSSVLPRVRTDGILYARAADTTLNRLYISRQWKPGKNIYARMSAGYFESMYGGVSGELLWKPVGSRLALGVEANYVKQRDFDQRFGFRDYSIATGHVSAYYDIGNGYQGQLDVGRYLAGDYGATATLSREFDNGWKVGGFFTLTDVSSADFGEGSFDKGILLTVPLNWFLGKPSQQSNSTTIRPIQRDGGARVSVPGRLYEQVRQGHKSSIVSDWSRVWE